MDSKNEVIAKPAGVEAHVALGEVTISIGCCATPKGLEASAGTGNVSKLSPFRPTEGVVKVWNSRQGFIQRAGHAEDLFFHKYGLSKDYQPAPGDRVTFQVSSSRSGRTYATNVRLCD